MQKHSGAPSDEKKWQHWWEVNQTYKTTENPDKKKFYVLDMFPYPSGAGLHVGHPLGYIASDILARYKRHCGYEVLHPMGFDSFGLPAEQYAIQTGQHPAQTTKINIQRYKEQLRNIGLSYDWSREVQTSSPEYYKWTQWIFIRLFHSWYNPFLQKAEPIDTLIKRFEEKGNEGLEEYCGQRIGKFYADEWRAYTEKQKSDVLMHYRLAYRSEGYVNWCPALGTVLANDEVKNGLSERGGHPVEKKKMMQWYLRISAYADRLLGGLDSIDWPESIKEAQRNWIGKSEGAFVEFPLKNSDKKIEVFTTRPDTLFGVSFLVLAPEYENLENLLPESHRKEVMQFVDKILKKSERERMAEAGEAEGIFTGLYVLHPFTGKELPVWIGEYVLAGYGTGAIMAVPGHDARDHRFAKTYGLPILQVIKGPDVTEKANEEKTGKLMASDFMNGLEVPEAIRICIEKLEEKKLGRRVLQYRMRDAVFGRQRYWGEPIPVYYDEEGIPRTLPEDELPLTLPEIDKYLPTADGQPPLARAQSWKYRGKYTYELTTMPGWAGSSWYFLRYMDPHNEKKFCDEEKLKYWNAVDVYVGGSEHATGHLLYARFWTKFLYDLGYLNFDEPFKKLINQGMIQGTSCIVYRDVNTNKIVSAGLKKQFENLQALHVEVGLERNGEISVEELKKWRDDFQNAEFILENGKLIPDHQVEKMSKRWFNVVNPDDICAEYGADTLRMYEMFLGPIEMSKPWNTNGISGVYNFLKKFRRIYEPDGKIRLSEDEPEKGEWKILHKTIKKVTEDIERMSLNTCVSTFMICTNELAEKKCNKRKILEPLLVLLSPFAPHLAEELWYLCGHTGSVTLQPWPVWNEEYLVEEEFDYPISFNGKTRFNIPFSLKLTKEEIEKEVLTKEEVQKYLSGKAPKKIIVVPGRIINIVV
ncbi:MAG: leucine--tRNA ligase [Bacteroidia bacterium]|nr:leucine--tRNA ligase [Bacteroidia bacterium]